MSFISGEFKAKDGQTFVRWKGRSGEGPGIFFCSGFRSDMEGAKALHVDALCARNGWPYVRFDYRGHGESEGVYTDFTLGDWIDDALAVMDHIAKGPQIVIGSSMGGWIALKIAQLRPEQVKCLIGLAPAPDFPSQLILPALNEQQRACYEQTGWIVDQQSGWCEPNRFSKRFIDESTHHNLLDKPYVFNGSVHIVQGEKDSAVPWKLARQLHDHITAPEISLTLLSEGDHRLSRPEDLELLENIVCGMYKRISAV